MGKPDGYIFWCSKCKVDHAGECETETVAETKPKPYAGIMSWLPVQDADKVAAFQKVIDQYIYSYYAGCYPGLAGPVIKIEGNDGK